MENLIISLCTNLGIELILATIPNTPIIDNSYKNGWVKSSGYKYIDFAKAVGADNGTTWYDDMLSSDNVHPTEQGAIALMSRVIIDCPEILG